MFSLQLVLEAGKEMRAGEDDAYETVEAYKVFEAGKEMREGEDDAYENVEGVYT